MYKYGGMLLIFLHSLARAVSSSRLLEIASKLTCHSDHVIGTLLFICQATNLF